MEGPKTRIVICLDGGGTRARITLEILRKFIQNDIDLIAECDMICGTSTGGMITLASLVGCSIDEINKLYTDQSAKDVFKFTEKNVTSTGALADTAKYEGIIRDIFKGKKIPDGDHCQKAFVVTTSIAKDGAHEGKRIPMVIRNYHNSVQGDLKIPKIDYLSKLLDDPLAAIRATSAIPGLFDEYEDKDYEYLDGGYVFNCPVSLAYLEARKLWPNDKIVVISIGTGYTLEKKEIDILESINHDTNATVDKTDFKLVSPNDPTCGIDSVLQLKNEINYTKNASPDTFKGKISNFFDFTSEVFKVFYEFQVLPLFVHKKTSTELYKDFKSYDLVKKDSSLFPYRFDSKLLKEIELWDFDSELEMVEAVRQYSLKPDFKNSVEMIRKIVHQRQIKNN